jgi:hypothetical protein
MGSSVLLFLQAATKVTAIIENRIMVFFMVFLINNLCKNGRLM